MGYLNSMKKKKKVLLTGPSGTIGQHLLMSDLRDDFYFICVSRAKYFGAQGDENIITNDWSPTELKKIMQGVDAVVHLAAETRSAKKATLFESNQNLTKSLVEAAVAVDLGLFMFFSTNLAENPNCEYSKSKLRCEEIISESSMKEWVIFRSAPVWVTQPPANNSNVYKLIKSVKTNKVLVLPAGGRFYISPVWINDVLSNIFLSLTHEVHRKKIVDLKGENVNVRDLLQIVAHKYSVKLKVINIPIKPLRVIARLARFTGFKRPVIDTICNLKLTPEEMTNKTNAIITSLEEVLSEV